MKARSAECQGPKNATTQAELKSMRAACFHKQRIAVLPLDALPEMEEIVVTQICERLYGKGKRA
jgi:hypothetical protein